MGEARDQITPPPLYSAILLLFSCHTVLLSELNNASRKTAGQLDSWTCHTQIRNDSGGLSESTTLTISTMQEEPIFQFTAPSQASTVYPPQTPTATTTAAAPSARARSAAYSRATSLRPKTATAYTSASDESPWLCAVIEAKAESRIVGLACLCLEHAQLVLCEIQGDSSTYTKTVHALTHRMPADAILLPHSTLSSMAHTSNDTDVDMDFRATDRPPAAHTGEAILVNVLQEAFQDAELVPVMRKHWNSDTGKDLISSLAVEDDDKTALLKAVESKSVIRLHSILHLIQLVERYYALSAVSALTKYAEVKRHVVLPRASIRIRLVPLQGTCFIDIDSVVSAVLLVVSLTLNGFFFR